MELDRYVEAIQHQLEVAADAGGDEVRALARRLIAPLDAAIRLALQDALAAAAEEITVDLAPGSVEVRLRGREPEFVVSLVPVDQAGDSTGAGDDPADGWRTVASEGAGDDAAISRINLRMPEGLKTRVEQAAGSQGLSVNSWLVRAAAATLERAGSGSAARRDRRTPSGSQRYTGWAR